MSMNDPASIERKVGARLRILFIIWAAQIMSLLIFALLAVLVFRPNQSANPSLFWIFAALGVLVVALSFPLKQKFLAESLAEKDEMQSAMRVQTGYIVAWALCESAGLFGLLTRAITPSPYFYVLFIIAVAGMLLHFPRREEIASASFKNKF